MSNRKLGTILCSALVLLLVMASACQPQVIEVEKEVVVEKVIEKAVEVEVEAAPEIAYVEVEKEVETIVEVEKEVVVETIVEVAPAIDQNISIVIAEEPPNLDVSDTGPGSAFNNRITMNVYEGLTGRDASGAVVGLLAESWEQTDETTWTFSLRQGVSFNNGVPFNAENVKWNLDRVQDPDQVAYVAEFSSSPVTVTIVDDYTVELSSPGANPILARELTGTMMGEQSAVDAGTDLVGTGPYVLQEWQAGEHIILAANPDYWGGAPTIQTATFVWRPDASVRSAMLQAGEVHIADGLTPQVSGPVRTLGADIPETPFLYFDPNGPLADLRVRQAICQSMDRDVIANQIMSGFATPANELATPDVCGYNPDIPVPAYDPDGARALVEAARADGVPVDEEITLYGRTGIYPNATETMEAIQLWMTEIGLNATLQMNDVAVWREINLAIPVPDGRVGITQSSSGLETGDSWGAIRRYLASFVGIDTWYKCEGYEEHGGGARPCVDSGIMEPAIAAKSLSEEEGRCEALGEVFKYHSENILWSCPMVRLQSLWGVSESVDWHPRPDNLILLNEASLLN